MSRESIAKALKRLREQSNLTADQVGLLVGKSGKTVNAWENNRGQPDAEILITEQGGLHVLRLFVPLVLDDRVVRKQQEAVPDDDVAHQLH